MSPGNLYRYFPGKIDIAEAMGREAISEGAASLAADAEEGATASEKLRIFLMLILERTTSGSHPDRKLFEVIHILISHRPDFAQWRRSLHQNIVQHIIQEGVDSGEFAVADAGLAAKRVLCATSKYSYPELYTKEPLEVLKAELEGLINLLLRALSVPEGPESCAGENGTSSDTAASARTTRH